MLQVGPQHAEFVACLIRAQKSHVTGPELIFFGQSCVMELQADHAVCGPGRLAPHYKIWKYCLSTSKVHAQVLQKLRVHLGTHQCFLSRCQPLGKLLGKRRASLLCAPSSGSPPGAQTAATTASRPCQTTGWLAPAHPLSPPSIKNALQPHHITMSGHAPQPFFSGREKPSANHGNFKYFIWGQSRSVCNTSRTGLYHESISAMPN